MSFFNALSVSNQDGRSLSGEDLNTSVKSNLDATRDKLGKYFSCDMGELTL